MTGGEWGPGDSVGQSAGQEPRAGPPAEAGEAGRGDRSGTQAGPQTQR